MSQFLNSINEVRKNYTIYDEWEQKQADEKAQKQYLAKTLDIPHDEVELTKQKAETVIRASEMLDKRSEDNCEDMEQFTNILASALMLIPYFGSNAMALNFMKKGNRKASMIAQFGGLVATFAGTIGTILWGNHKQKEASRIGRYQAKQDELKDVKNFVIYTPEQIKTAEEKAKDAPDKKEKESLMESFANVKRIFKDKKAYENWHNQKDPEMLDKLKQQNYTPEQLLQGEKDKELIVDTVKEINIKAEEYSENLENVFDTMSIFSFVVAAPAAWGINKLLKHVKNLPKKVKPFVAAATAFAAPIGIMIWGTQEQKKSARIGRFQARQDLLKDPASLMHFTEEQKAQAKDIKADKQKKGFFSRIGENFKFLGTYLGDKKEYSKYKKNTAKENEKVLEELKKMDVSEKQLKDAEHIQEKLYLAFDEIDEMSQRYSEDTEAATEIAKQTANSMWSIGSMAALAALPLFFVKGKLPVDKIIKKISNLSLDQNSNIRKLIDQGYEILKSNPELRKNALKELGRSKFTSLQNNEALKPVISGLKDEFGAIFANGIGGKEKLMEAIQKHFKKGPVAKWARGMTFEGMKLWGKKGMNGAEAGLPSELTETLKFNYKNYPTLCNTGIVAGLPVLGAIVGVPYAFNSWMTSIQKKAGKIGIMKAMDQIDDAKIFVNSKDPSFGAQSPTSETSFQAENTQPVNTQTNSTNLLDKFKKVS